MPPRGVKKGTKRAGSTSTSRRAPRSRARRPIAPRRSRRAPSTRSGPGRASRGRARARPRATCPRAAAAACAPARAGAKGRTKEQLYAEAKKLGVEGRSKMTKAQLQRAIAGKKANARATLPAVTRRRRRTARSTSLQRDNRVCRACAEAGYPARVAARLRGARRPARDDRRPGARRRRGRRAAALAGPGGPHASLLARARRGGLLRDVLLRLGHALLPGEAPVRSRRPPGDAGRDGPLLVLARLGAPPPAAGASSSLVGGLAVRRLLGLPRLTEASAGATRSAMRSPFRFPIPRARAAGSTTPTNRRSSRATRWRSCARSSSVPANAGP